MYFLAILVNFNLRNIKPALGSNHLEIAPKAVGVIDCVLIDVNRHPMKKQLPLGMNLVTNSKVIGLNKSLF